MLQGLLHVERRVESAEHDLDAHLAETPAEFVGPWRRRRHHGDAHQINRFVPRHLVDLFVDEANRMRVRCERRDAQQREHREAEGPPVEEALAAQAAPVTRCRGDEQDPHGSLRV